MDKVVELRGVVVDFKLRSRTRRSSSMRGRSLKGSKARAIKRLAIILYGVVSYAIFFLFAHDRARRIVFVRVPSNPSLATVRRVGRLLFAKNDRSMGRGG